jgi:hypothetical protein
LWRPYSVFGHLSHVCAIPTRWTGINEGHTILYKGDVDLVANFGVLGVIFGGAVGPDVIDWKRRIYTKISAPPCSVAAPSSSSRPATARPNPAAGVGGWLGPPELVTRLDLSTPDHRCGTTGPGVPHRVMLSTKSTTMRRCRAFRAHHVCEDS